MDLENAPSDRMEPKKAIIKDREKRFIQLAAECGVVLGRARGRGRSRF
jgi:hypothetical protein